MRLKGFWRHYTPGWPLSLKDLWRYPRWLLFHRKRVPYVPWSFGVSARKITRKAEDE